MLYMLLLKMGNMGGDEGEDLCVPEAALESSSPGAGLEDLGIVVGHGKVVIVAEPLMHSKTGMNQIATRHLQIDFLLR